jgi:hypothetical protein
MAQAPGEAHVIKLRNKSYAIDPKEVPALKAAAAEAWKPTLRVLKNIMANARAMWVIHNEARSGSFMTFKVIEAVARARFPPESEINAADADLARMAGAIGAHKLAEVVAAFNKALVTVKIAAEGVQQYHEAICGGAQSCVTGLTAVQNGSVLIVEVGTAIATMGASVEVQAGVAAGVGSYKEILAQIDKSSNAAGAVPVLKVIAVLSAGARDGLIAHFMGPAQIGKQVTEYVGKKAGAFALKKLKSEVSEKLVEKIMAEGADEAIKTALADLINATGYTGMQKLSFEQAVQHVATQCLLKMHFANIFGSLNKQIDKMTDTVFEKLAKGAIKGIEPIKDEKSRKAAMGIVESTLAKLVPQLILQYAADPRKLEDLDGLVLAALGRDQAFAGQMKKLKK